MNENLKQMISKFKPFTIVRYDTIEKVFEHIGATPVFETVDEVEGCLDFESTNEIATEEAIEGMKEVGVWGFIDENNVIHFWAEQGIDQNMMAYFLGHEIGHLVSKLEPDVDCVKDDEFFAEFYDGLKEEFVANGYGFVVYEVNRLLKEIFDTTPEEHDNDLSLYMGYYE